MINNRNLFDPANPNESSNIGAYLRDAAGNLATSTLVGAKQAIDVYVANPIDVDIQHTTDSIKIGDGTDFLAINADGSINAVVTATNLDIRDLTFAQDKVDVSGSTVTLDAGSLAALESITVQNGAGAAAVNIQDGGNSITVDNANLVSLDSKFTSYGTSILVSDIANTAIENTATAIPVTATALLTTQLAARKYLFTYNNGNKEVFVGKAAVTVTNGYPIFPGGYAEFRLGAAVSMYAISASGTQDQRIMEFS